MFLLCCSCIFQLRYPTGHDPLGGAAWSRKVSVKSPTSTSPKPTSPSKVQAWSKEDEAKCGKFTRDKFYDFILRGEHCYNAGNKHIAVEAASHRVVKFEQKKGCSLREQIKQEVRTWNNMWFSHFRGYIML